MTILKGLYKAEWEHNQPLEHNAPVEPISIMDGLVTLPTTLLPLNYDGITIENCYAVVKNKTNILYGTKR